MPMVKISLSQFKSLDRENKTRICEDKREVH